MGLPDQLPPVPPPAPPHVKPPLVPQRPVPQRPVPPHGTPHFSGPPPLAPVRPIPPRPIDQAKSAGWTLFGGLTIGLLGGVVSAVIGFFAIIIFLVSWDTETPDDFILIMIKACLWSILVGLAGALISGTATATVIWRRKQEIHVAKQARSQGPPPQ